MPCWDEGRLASSTESKECNLEESTFCVYTAGPNTALVKSSGRREVRIVIGGRILAVPIIQRVDSLSLELRTITVKTRRGTTKNGVAVDVTSCCQVKIQGWSLARDGDDPVANSEVANGDLKIDKLAIRLAAQHFIGKRDNEIEDAIQKTIAGHQRSIIGVLTVEELYRDRAAFSRKVLDLISEDMRHMGLTVVSYTVAEITDENGYIEALGVTQTEKVKRDATEGKAEHQSHGLTRKAQEEAVAHMAVNEQQQLRIESDKKRQVAYYEAQQEIDREQARQQKAGLITHEERNAVLFVTRQKALAAEAKAELDVLQQNVHKERLTMEKEVHAKADAMLYKAKVDADGIRASAEAEAYRIREVGQAEAASIKAKGQAEIDVLRSRVMVWKECGNQAALLEQMVAVLPRVAEAVAGPLSKTEKMVFVGSGGSGGGGGPSQFTREMERIVAEVPETVRALTGVDIHQGIGALMAPDTKQSMIQGTAEGVSTALAEQITPGFVGRRRHV
ncbi:unnamed protein product [Chondrus crispus]|uniref:Band 7 domain-containing protein n=1 Tax=Chondrus crispus TaxID=2769 RepID=R7QMG2_CHOCR|nr:unnamed protein product [Chondrus crispus]CDF39289.1 unnamed protein product [Chondrus crispus]|eukprot:XP_005719200.1 unnamed protein product [Chondrus crispus]